MQQREEGGWNRLEWSTGGQRKGTIPQDRPSQGTYCRLCGAWRGSLGLEPTPEQYVANMVAVFREVRRVMRGDGTLWLNLGDSYSGSWGNYGAREGKQRSRISERWHRPAYEDARAGWDGLPPTANVPGLKPKDLVGIPWRVAFALQADGWWLRSDIIWHKCLSGGARVYAKTQKGEMPTTVKDLVRLDPATVQLWDGEKWNQVHSWEMVEPSKNRQRKSQRRRSAKYRGKITPGDIEIELRNGERIGCTRNHKWPTMRGIVLAKDLQIGDVLESATLPEPDAPRKPSLLQNREIAWFIGIYLAEGSISQGTIQIASHISEQDRFERLKTLAESFDGHCFKFQTSKNGMTINVNSPLLLALIDTYLSGKGAKGKHLNVRCWQRSNTFLADLLDGYLEGDGHKVKEGYWRIGFTSNDSLASDLRTIAARIGCSLRLRRRKAKIKDKEYPCWRGDLRMDPSTRRTKDSEVIAIRQSRARKFWNISLMDEPHIFCLASGICTKNSNPMPESVTDRPTKSHEYLFLLSKRARYYYDNDAIREPQVDPSAKGGKVYGSRLMGKDTPAVVGREREYNPAGRNRRTVWTHGEPLREFLDYCISQGVNVDALIDGYLDGQTDAKDVWTIATKPYSGAHFATFPPALVEPCIKAGTSERGVCDSCGSPWERVIRRGNPIQQHWAPGTQEKIYRAQGKHGESSVMNTGFTRPNITTGWRPTCSCPPADPRPATVLDPFVGSGTTLLVARQLGRQAIGLDLSFPYLAEQARSRLELDKLEAWGGNGREAEANLEGLPMFAQPLTPGEEML